MYLPPLKTELLKLDKNLNVYFYAFIVNVCTFILLITFNCYEINMKTAVAQNWFEDLIRLADFWDL